MAALQVRRAEQGPGPVEIDCGLDSRVSPWTVDSAPGALVLEECMRWQMFGTLSSEKSIPSVSPGLFLPYEVSTSTPGMRFSELKDGVDTALFMN